jgi:Putative auto-transporter adhesin, head GIN domain
VRASGTTDSLEVELNGSGEAQLQHLVARDVHAVVSGSGRARVNATETLEASVPGSGAIEYKGGPTQVKKTVHGVGYVTAAQ